MASNCALSDVLGWTPIFDGTTGTKACEPAARQRRNPKTIEDDIIFTMEGVVSWRQCCSWNLINNAKDLSRSLSVCHRSTFRLIFGSREDRALNMMTWQQSESRQKKRVGAVPNIGFLRYCMV